MDISGVTGAYQEYYSSLAGGVRSDSLSSRLDAAGKKDNATDDELMDVCKQFESYLLEQVFKNMEKTVMKDESNQDSSTSMLVDFFKENTIRELAATSTENSPLGLAQMLYDQLKVNMGIDPEELAQNAIESGAAAVASDEE